MAWKARHLRVPKAASFPNTAERRSISELEDEIVILEFVPDVEIRPLSPEPLYPRPELKPNLFMPTPHMRLPEAMRQARSYASLERVMPQLAPRPTNPILISPQLSLQPL